MKKLFNFFLLAIVCLLSSCDEYPVSSVTLDRSSLNLDVDSTYQLECVILPLSSAYANSTTWKSSDASVATVNSSGVVTAVYSGSCTITASADGHKAVCQVVVNPLDYSFSFDRAGTLYYGDAYEVGNHNFVLRLLSDGLTMDDDGLLSGEGLFANFDIQLPLTDLALTAGTYTLSEVRSEYTFTPGELYEESGNQYAIGTFVGQRTSDGLSVIFVKSGSFWITITGNTYKLEAHLLGEKGEDMVVTFSGLIPVIDKTDVNLPETITLDPVSADIESLGDIYNVGLNVFRQTVTHAADTVLQIEFYAPLSITDQLPSGTYQFSGTKTYSLVPASTNNGLLYGAWFTDTQGSVKVLGGQVVVAQTDSGQSFKYRLIDESGRIIDIQHTY